MRFSTPLSVLWMTGCSPRQPSVCLSGTRCFVKLLHQRFGCRIACASWSNIRVPSFTDCSLNLHKNSIHKRYYAASTESDGEDGMMSDSEFDGNVFLRRKLLEKDQLDTLRVNLYPASNDPVIKKINEANSMQEVFDQIDTDSGPPTAEQLSQAIVTLWDLQKVYGRYGYDCSMITKYEIKQFLEKILNHPSFERIISCLEAVCGDLNSNALSSMLLYLSKLGLSNHSPIQQKLSLLCFEKINDFNLTALSRLSVYLREQGIRAYFLQSKLLPLIANKLDHYLDADEFLMITICLNSTKRLVTKSLIEKFINLVEKRIDEGFFKTCDPRITLKVIKLVTYPEWSPMRRCVRHLMKCLEENFHALTVVQVLDLSTYFQSYLEPCGIFHKIRQYSVNAMEDSKVSGGRPDILCLAPFTPLQAKHYFEVLVAEQLEQNDVYEYIMVLFKALRHIKTSNTKLCDAFWMQAINSVEEELKNSSSQFQGLNELARRKVYLRYMYFNNNLGGTYRNFALEKTITHLLVEDLNTILGHLPNKVAHMASFIISYSSRDGIPEDVYEKIILCGPQFSIFDTLLISRGIQISLALNRKNVKRKLMQQITTICHMLDARTEEFLKTATGLVDVINLTRAYLNRMGSPRTFTFDRIISAYTPLVHELNARHLRDISLSFTSTLYLAPEILEALSLYVMDNQESLLAETMELLLTCIYTLGYTPHNVDQLLAGCTNTLLQESHNLKGLSVLQMCLAMNMYGYLPSEVIQSVFNLKFMDKLDEEIEKCYSKATYPMRVRHLLMELNRAVCLDHPEENIPWFHEKYCEEYLETVAVPTTVFHGEVYQALTQLVGGPDVLRANVHSPYFYLLDFEFVLDGNNNPVPVKDYTPSSPGSSRSKKIAIENNLGHRRMAVILRRENHYCTNSRQLLGRHQVECRHLELMGYTVVEVPHFLWYSMAHATNEDRVQYLRDQIFPVR